MKIRTAVTHCGILRLRRDVRTAQARYAERPGRLLRVEDAEGRVGFGEASPLTDAEPTFALESAALALEGQQVPEALDAVLALVQGAISREFPASRYALELALLELMCQARDVSLARLLNPRARETVDVNALLDAESPDLLANEARTRAAEGFRTLKVKVGRGTLEADVLRLEAVRRAVGSSVRLRADANGAWGLSRARAALEAFVPLELELLEQPLAVGEELALGELCKLKLCLLAADESVGVPSALERLREGRGFRVAVLVLKPTVLGGLLPALALAQEASEAGVEAYVTHALEGPWARAGAVHLAAAIPQSSLASGVCLAPAADFVWNPGCAWSSRDPSAALVATGGSIRLPEGTR